MMDGNSQQLRHVAPHIVASVPLHVSRVSLRVPAMLERVYTIQG